ncbi:MAG: hypothetical protein WBQ41_01985 [Solirubrobacterales bacterium]
MADVPAPELGYQLDVIRGPEDDEIDLALRPSEVRYRQPLTELDSQPILSSFLKHLSKRRLQSRGQLAILINAVLLVPRRQASK